MIAASADSTRDAQNEWAAPEALTPLRDRSCLLAITILGALLRLYGLARYSLWYDEGSTMYMAGLVPTPSRLFNPDWGTEPPLVPVLVHYWLKIAHGLFSFEQGSFAGDFALRLLPCLFSIATLPLVFLVAIRFTRNSAAALATAFLIAISPLHVYYAQELRPYATLVFLAMCALWCLLRALESDRALDWAGLVFFLTLSMYNHFFSVWTIFALNAGMLFVLASRLRLLPKWIAVQSAVIVFSLPAIRQGLVINHVTSLSTRSWYPPLTFKTGVITFTNFFSGYSPDTVVYKILALSAAVLVIVGIYAMRKRPAALILLLTLSLIPILGNLALWQTRPFSYYEHRLFILCGVAFTILIGNGIAALHPRWIGAAVLLAFAGLTAPTLIDHYEQRLHPTMQHRLGARYKVGNRPAAQFVREGFRDGDLIAHFSPVTFNPFYYYYLPNPNQFAVGLSEYDRRGVIDSFPREAIWKNLKCIPERIDSIAPHAKRIWFVESWWEPNDLPVTARMLRDWLDNHGVRLECRYFDGLTVYLYDLEQMRSGHPRLEQTSDYGDVSAVRYRAGGKIVAQSAKSDLDKTIAVAHTPAMSFSTGVSTWEKSDLASALVGVKNEIVESSTLQARVVTSVDFVPAMAFARIEPESDRWHYTRYDSPGAIDPIGLVSVATKLSPGAPPDSGVYAETRVPAGKYDLYAYVWQEIDPANHSRARLVIEAGPTDASRPPATIGEFTPCVSGSSIGWNWIRAGEVNSDGGALRLNVRAESDIAMRDVFADVGGVAFLPAAAMNLGMSPSNVLSKTMPVQSGLLTVEPPQGISWEDIPVQYDVFVFDAKTNQRRVLSFRAAP